MAPYKIHENVEKNLTFVGAHHFTSISKNCFLGVHLLRLESELLFFVSKISTFRISNPRGLWLEWHMMCVLLLTQPMGID